MRRILFILGFLLCAFPASASISKIGGCKAATTSCTMPGNAVGDYIYAFAFRSATTAPTLPAGFTSIATASASSSSFRSGCKVATTTSETSGTWTNATSITVEIYRGASATTTANCATAGAGIGGNTNNSGTTSTITYGTITMTVADGTSWVIGASGSSGATCTPTGMTSEQAQTTVNILNDTNAGVSSWSSTNCTGSTGNWKSNVIEILAALCNSTGFGNGATCVQQSSSVNAGSGTTVAVTLAGVSSSNVVLLGTAHCQAADCNTAVTNTDTVSDTGTSTCTKSPNSPFTFAATNQDSRGYLWACTGLSAGSHTWTMTSSGTAFYFGVLASEWSGLPGTFDSANVDSSALGTGTSVSLSTSATTSNAVNLIYALDNFQTSLPTVGTGFTGITQNSSGMSAEAKTVSATGTQTATWTHSPSQNWQDFIVPLVITLSAGTMPAAIF